MGGWIAAETETASRAQFSAHTSNLRSECVNNLSLLAENRA